MSPKKYVLPRAFSLSEACTNNVAECNALLIGMKIACELGTQHLEAYGDSMLIINQVRGEFAVRHEYLVPYHITAIQVTGLCETFHV